MDILHILYYILLRILKSNESEQHQFAEFETTSKLSKQSFKSSTGFVASVWMAQISLLKPQRSPNEYP